MTLYKFAVFSWRVPVGYDGSILAFLDASNEWELGQYVYEYADENSLFFRFENTDNQN